MGILDGKSQQQQLSSGGILRGAQSIISANRMNEADQIESDIMATQPALTPYIAPEPDLPNGRSIPVVGPILRGLDYIADNPISKAIAEYTVPNAPYIDQPDTNARQSFLDRNNQEAATGVPKFIGQGIAPFFVPGAQLGTGTAATDAAQGILSKFVPKLQGIGQAAAREGLSGAAIGAGSEFAQGQGDLGNAALSGLYGAGLGAAGGAALSGLSRYLPKAPEPPAEELLGLPSPTLALPSPRVIEPTSARIETPQNPYRQKLESLFSEAKRMQASGEIRPGFEREELDNLWGKMAGPNDPGLDDLINLAYAPRPNRIQPNLVQQARGYQQSRQSAGVGLPVRTAQERYPAGVKAQAAPIRTQYASPTPEIPGSNELVNAQRMKGNWFTDLFGNQGLGASAVSSSKKISEGPLTTEGQIVKNGLKNDKQGWKDEAAAQARAAYQNFVDKLSPLKKIGDNTYETAMDAARANNIANTIVRDKFVTPEGNIVGEGLEGIFKKVARGQDKQFIDYLTLRHAKTRMERGERVYAENLNMTPEAVQQRLAMYDNRHPGFDQIAKEWDQFNDNMLQNYGVNEGLLTPEAYTTMRESNPNYSPMRRQFSRSEKPGRNFLAKTTSSSFSGQKAPIQKVSPTGSVRNIIDPRRTTVEAAGAWVNAAMRNRVMQSMADQISRNPEAFKGIAEIVQKPASKLDLNEVLAHGGPDDFVESLNNDFKDLFKTTKVDGDNIVRAMVKGQPVYLQVHDPEIVKTLIGMGPQASNILLDTMGAFSNATKRGATGLLAPMFAVKGATMDLAQSAIQSKTPVKQAAYTVYAIFSGIGDRLNIPVLKNLAEEFRRSGGEYSAALKGDRAVDKSIGRMTREPLLSPKGVAKGLGMAVTAPFKALESIGDIAENAPRIAAYRNEMKSLGGERTPENVRQAMSASREITTNFSRKGALGRELEAAVPYNNAAIQGLYRFGKAFKENPIRTTAAVATLSVLPKMIEYMQFADDPDYQQIPARERYRNLIVHKNDDGTFTKVPMEPSYNAIGELAIDILRANLKDDPQAMKGVADALANAYTPPLVTGALQGVTQGGGMNKSIGGVINSTVAAPFAAVMGNQSFTGAPIESKAVSDRSPDQRYDEKTSGIAKQIGPKVGLSPMKTEYLLRSYGGDPARLLLPLTSDVGAGDTRNTLLKSFNVDPTFTNTLTNDYYAMKEKLSQAYADNKEADKPLPSWYDEDLRKELASTAKGSISKKLSTLSDEKKTIQANRNLTAEQKTNNLRAIQSQINDIYVDINSKLQRRGVPHE